MFCELRLDNVVYRAGWGATRPQSRQFVNHGHVEVNGRRVNVPSYRLRKGDVVRLRDKSRSMVVLSGTRSTTAAHHPHGSKQPTEAARSPSGAAPEGAHRHSRQGVPDRRALLQVVPEPTKTSETDSQFNPDTVTTSPETGNRHPRYQMLVIQRPTVEAVDDAIGNTQRFSISPLEPGFGHTLGNSLRRTLLSSIPARRSPRCVSTTHSTSSTRSPVWSRTSPTSS
ncbi:MAG: S4 domain-containing protein [Microthrixaceae bacterium]